MRHLSALGNGPALVVFNWLAAAGQAMEQRWIESMTDLSDKTVSRALQKLTELQYVVQVDGGWMVATAQQGVLGDVLAALPAEPARLTEGGQDTSGDITQADSDAGVGNSPTQSYVVGVGLSNSLKDLSTNTQQHQQDDASRKVSDSPENLPAGDPDRGRARLALLRLGVWPKQVDFILVGLDPDRGLGDVLGWIAYCQDPQQGIENAAAIVAGKLKRAESPGSAWLAPRVCAACHQIEGRCLCAEPQFNYPADYDELAFEPPPNYGRDDWLANRWRCARCFGHPCKCEPDNET